MTIHFLYIIPVKISKKLNKIGIFLLIIFILYSFQKICFLQFFIVYKYALGFTDLS